MKKRRQKCRLFIVIENQQKNVENQLIFLLDISEKA